MIMTLKSHARTAALFGLCTAALGLSLAFMPAAHAQTAIDTAKALEASGAAASSVAATGAAPATPAAAGATTAVPAAGAAAGAQVLKTVTTPNGSTVDIPAPEAPKVALDEPFNQSLFLAPEDLVAIERALKGVISAGSAAGGGPQEIPQVRKITVSGVFYKNPNEWVVWINGQKIVPGLMLKEIVDIRVERDLVHLKWFDVGLNGVINITLRPHDTYDIVTGVLLPG